VSVPLSRLLPHPAYAGEATSADVALARLARPVRGLSPVCLPPPGLRLPAGTRCVSTGWGDTGGERGTGIYWEGLGWNWDGT
ncbi:PRS27 protease, partial [Hirundo rustica]|nr:PRS27 protease [Hirundo rustica]